MTQNKRLILIVTIFPQISETFIVKKFLSLLALGWDVHIVCDKLNKRDWLRFPELDASPKAKNHIHQTLSNRPRYLIFLLFPFVIIRSFLIVPMRTLQYFHKGFRRFGLKIFRHFILDANLLILQPDIIHFEFGALANGRSYLKELLNVKLSASFRGYDLNFVGLDDPNYYDDLWNHLDKCHFLSQHLKNRAIERGFLSEIPFEIINPAIDNSKVEKTLKDEGTVIGTKNRPVRILSVGRLEWKKGYEHAIQAIKLLVDDGIYCKYEIIGGGNYKPALQFASHQLGLDEHIIFYGSIPHSDVLQKYQWADIFLHPSLSEGFCNVALEAQASGIPVVATDAGGLPENVADGETGFIVPRRDPYAMFEKIRHLTKDADLRNKMGKSGKERVNSHFQIETQMDAFESFYALL